MAKEGQSTPGMGSGLVQDFIAQHRAVTAEPEDLAESGERRSQAPGACPLPGALPAAQLTSIASSVAAQRRSIEALKGQLSSFDEQLAVLEQIPGPLAEWSRTRAQVEDRLLSLHRGPSGQEPGQQSLTGQLTAPVVTCSWHAASHPHPATSQQQQRLPRPRIPRLAADADIHPKGDDVGQLSIGPKRDC